MRPKNALDRHYLDYKEKVARSFEQKQNSKAYQQMNRDIEAGKKAAVENREREERLADKRRRGAPKREEKAKLK